MKRLVGLAVLLALPAGLVAGWLLRDESWAGLPPPSLLRAPLQRELPPALADLARLLPERQAAALDVASLPPWAAPVPAPRSPSRRPASLAALREALAQAQPGDVIELQPGEYVVDATLRPGQAGRPDAPIVLRGAPGARLRSVTVEAIKLAQPHWVIEHLEMQGDCRPAQRCEHALHIVGRAHHTELLGLRLSNFNAAIKVNGEDGAWPDHGRLSHSLLANDAPRAGDVPVTPFDLVGASHWRVEDNRVWGVAKQGGNAVAYAAYMKGGGQQGRFERNLIVCAPGPGFAGVGQQVGLSFGGGGTDPGTLRDQQTRLEHVQGLATDNVVINCSDSALDVNESAAITLRANLLLGSGGLVVRGHGASAEALDNLASRPAYAMPGNELEARGNRRVQPAGTQARAVLAQLRSAGAAR